MAGNRGWAAVFLVAGVLLSSAPAGAAAGQSTVTLTVTVVDRSGDPVGGVDLSATWPDGGGPVTETTASNGKAFVDVPAGANVTIAVHDDRHVRNSPHEVTDASNRDVEIPVAREGSATVVVTDGEGPVPDALVRMRHDGEYVVDGRTNGEGRLTTGAIERGTYEVQVRKAGHLRNTTSVDVDGDVTAEVAIERGARLLTVRVLDDHFSPPRPVANASVTVAGIGTVSTLPSGNATLAVPVNSDYEVSVTEDGYGTNATTVDVAESRRTVDLTVRRTPGIDVRTGNERVVVGGTVRVTVTDEYGDSVEGATVTLGDETVGETGDDGVLRVPVERAGDRPIAATVGDLEAAATVEGVDPDGTASPTVANGTATDSPSGIGGPGFTVSVAVVAVLVVAGLLGRR